MQKNENFNSHTQLLKFIQNLLFKIYNFNISYAWIYESTVTWN